MEQPVPESADRYSRSLYKIRFASVHVFNSGSEDYVDRWVPVGCHFFPFLTAELCVILGVSRYSVFLLLAVSCLLETAFSLPPFLLLVLVNVVVAITKAFDEPLF